MPMLKKLHLYIGLAALAAFLLTGQYLHWVHDHLQGMPEGPRLFLRSSHIYLLWAALLNIALGCHTTYTTRGVAKALQIGGSMAILLSPLLLAWSFAFEPYQAELHRPVAWWGIHLAFAGVLAQTSVALFVGQNKQQRG